MKPRAGLKHRRRSGRCASSKVIELSIESVSLILAHRLKLTAYSS
jgi:hypothetical protein